MFAALFLSGFSTPSLVDVTAFGAFCATVADWRRRLASRFTKCATGRVRRAGSYRRSSASMETLVQ